MRARQLATQLDLSAQVLLTLAMSKAWDEMADNAGRFDGSFEAARDKFNALKEQANG
jgi:hypothetical protein